jgi:hypothetical protein
MRDRVRDSGVFVYQGSGAKQSADAPVEQRKCIREARAVQFCLAQSNYQQKYCEHLVDAMKRCHTLAKNSEAGSDLSHPSLPSSAATAATAAMTPETAAPPAAPGQQ